MKGNPIRELFAFIPRNS